MNGKAPVIGRRVDFSILAAEQIQQPFFTGPRDNFINQTAENIFIACYLGPRSRQGSAQYDFLPGIPAADKSDHGESAKRLAEIIQGKSYEFRIFFQGVFQAGSKVRIKKIVLRRLGGFQQVAAFYRS
jgi:hypothetical protein